jgi:putative radical SAM enzyme (TIGR03279 family)
MKIGHIIKNILPGSIAEELELEPGDRVLAVNDQEIEDVFDYHYLVEDEYIELTVLKKDGDEWILEIEKDEDEDLGIEFESSLMDEYHSCTNKCIFCFIDQLPAGMRDTMYFKDDDSRLSFLQGNYITLTNMKDKDLERIIRYKLSPINVSVHTTNPELRCMMLHNRFAGKIMEQLRKLYEAGVLMNGQIVLCKGVNDGEELRKTIGDLGGFLPYMESLSVVPVGLSDHRDGLYPLEPFTREDAREVIEIIHGYQEVFMEEYDTHFVHASDEWYILAGLPLPEEDNYDGYVQLENGVGMLRLQEREFHEAMAEDIGEHPEQHGHCTIATGKLAGPFIKELVQDFNKKYPNIQVDVIEVTNYFFGPRITVSGLLTGQDILRALKGKNLGNRLLLPVNVLRSGEDVLLDDIHVTELEKTLQVPIRIVQSNGKDLYDALVAQGADTLI